ncbi:unnamed protein product [Adineta ricciae]|uniref:HAT C-terminal dimerisation domain-containing protein n=1 Tax=Adineta ricciae TaxID=249248 RepID=A0A815ZJG4_ADIRI|nr:unnamed protein product [Adineta ricciae]
MDSNETDEDITDDPDESLVQPNELSTDAGTSTDSQLRNPNDIAWAICDLCPPFPTPKCISTKGGATSTLQKHLINAHKKIDLILVPCDDKRCGNLSAAERDKLHQLLINAIIVDGRCFSDFRKLGFSRFLEYAIPVMTGHYLSNSFELYSTVIDFSHFQERHFSENIMNYIYKKLDRLNVLGRVSTVTCDGASNMTKVFDTFGAVGRLWCLGQRLHLIVTNALGFWLNDKNKEINDAIDDTTTINPTDDVGDLDTKEIFNDEEDALAANDSDEETEMTDDVITKDNYHSQSRTSLGVLLRKCRTLASMIRRSSMLAAFFEKECYKIGSRRSPRADVFLALKTVICALFVEKHSLVLTGAQSKKLHCLELTSSDCNLLKKVSQTLTPFDLATKLLSGRQYPTIGNTELEQQLKRSLLDKMAKYIDDEKEQMGMLRIYGYFDPMGFAVLPDRERAMVERELKKLSSANPDKSFDSISTTAKSIELKHADSTVLQFWSTYARELPILSSLSRRFLATPGTSVPAEAAFSISSFIGRREGDAENSNFQEIYSFGILSHFPGKRNFPCPLIIKVNNCTRRIR